MIKRLMMAILIPLALAACGEKPPAPKPEAVKPLTLAAQTVSDLPRTYTLALTLSHPAELRVKPGQRVVVGQVMAERGQERRRLEARLAQLQLGLARLESVPLPRLSAERVLPPVSLKAEQVAIQQAQWAVAQAEAQRQRQAQKLAELKAIADADTLTHEQAQLVQLQAERQRAGLQLAAAQAQLERAEAQQRYARWQQQQAFQERQWQVAQQLQERQTAIAQFTQQISEVQHDLAQLAAVRSPYAALVRRVRWLPQRDQRLTAELTLQVQSAGLSGAAAAVRDSAESGVGAAPGALGAVATSPAQPAGQWLDGLADDGPR
jgi:chromosome segregation ATPase/predicted small lipoprotein YifL